MGVTQGQKDPVLLKQKSIYNVRVALLPQIYRKKLTTFQIWTKKR